MVPVEAPSAARALRSKEGGRGFSQSNGGSAGVVGRLVAMGSLPALPGGSGWNSGAGWCLASSPSVSVSEARGGEWR